MSSSPKRSAPNSQRSGGGSARRSTSSRAGRSGRGRPRVGRTARAADSPRAERLQKVLAAAGVASRRASEEMIESGRVRVDGEVVRVQGLRVDPARARIEVDGRRVEVNPTHEYILLNKPAGVVTTARDPQGRTTVLDLVRTRRRIYPVGRLDVETLGLVLLTDHGELAHRLMHPRFEVPRVYVAEVRGSVTQRTIDRLLRGVKLEDGVARARGAKVLRKTGSRSQVQITMVEGRKHEVRRMLEAVAHPATRLVRVAFGPLKLSGLPTGKSRALTSAEAGALLSAVGL